MNVMMMKKMRMDLMMMKKRMDLRMMKMKKDHEGDLKDENRRKRRD